MYLMSSQNLETTYKVKKFLSSDSVIGQSGCNQIPVIRQLKQPIIPSPPNTESITISIATTNYATELGNFKIWGILLV